VYGAKQLFIDHLERIYDFWVPLLRKTTLLPNTPYTDARVIAAFRELDLHIGSGDLHFTRLGYIQLTKMLATLRKRIASDRRDGRVFPKKRSASVAIDLYVSSQGQPPDRRLRNQVLRRVRTGKRWADYAGESPLLVITHSSKAEGIMYVHVSRSFLLPNSLFKVATWLFQIRLFVLSPHQSPNATRLN